jgi:hypothetical protein
MASTFVHRYLRPLKLGLTLGVTLVVMLPAIGAYLLAVGVDSETELIALSAPTPAAPAATPPEKVQDAFEAGATKPQPSVPQAGSDLRAQYAITQIPVLPPPTWRRLTPSGLAPSGDPAHSVARLRSSRVGNERGSIEGFQAAANAQPARESQAERLRFVSTGSVQRSDFVTR